MEAHGVVGWTPIFSEDGEWLKDLFVNRNEEEVILMAATLLCDEIGLEV